MRRPHWRKTTWAIVIWCGFILIWAVAGGGSAANDCAHQAGDQYLSAQTAQNACATVAGLGIALTLVIGFFGFFGFVFLSLIWFMTRTRSRACLVCSSVKRGVTRCGHCGHDFQAAVASGTA